jgi:uncharacterized protein
VINLPKIISIFPLSNFIIFPNTTVPLNIFESRYIEMIKDSMNSVGCLGKITKFKDTSDGRYLIDLNGLIRFNIVKEIKSNKLYRTFEITFDNYKNDLNKKKETTKFDGLDKIFKDLKSLFEKKGYIINWKSLKNQDLSETINALAMASPFTLEEKQILLESENLETRKNKIAEILTTYNYDNFDNTTVQ